MEQFRALGLSESTLEALRKKGFQNPTEIQSKIIPILLKTSVDIIGQAQTGTGKTAAFGLPLIDILDKNKVNHVQALILTPTRELAIQVADEISSFKGESSLQVAPIYGGQSIVQQLRRLKQGVDIVVGTPGRILDHIDRKSLKIADVSHVVLDEADEMLNMGFIDDITTILEKINLKKRMLLFSATMPKRLLAIAEKYMGKKEIVSVKKDEVTNNLVDQIYFEVHGSDKIEALSRVIDTTSDFYGIVFCRTKIDTEKVALKLIDRGYTADFIHGDVPQSKRERVLEKFKQKRTTILVATDVAARGIDVNNLTHVVNFSLPEDPESYVHRIGRTGRAGNAGRAITFVTREDMRAFSFIQKVAKVSIRRERVPAVEEIVAGKQLRVKQRIASLMQAGSFENYKEMAQELLTTYKADELICALIKSSFPLEVHKRGEMREVANESSTSNAAKKRLFIQLGRHDGLNSSAALVEFIRNLSKTNEKNFDNVQIFDKYSLFTVSRNDAHIIMQTFKRYINGQRILVREAR